MAKEVKSQESEASVEEHEEHGELVAEAKEEPKPTTFTQAQLDAEADKRIAKALDTAKAKWEEEAKAREDKAKKLAKMSEADRLKAQLKDREEELNRREHDLQMQRYSIEAQKQLKEHGLSTDLVDMVLSDDVEVTKQRIEMLSDQFNAAVQAKVAELSKQSSPKDTGSFVHATDHSQSLVDFANKHRIIKD